MSPSTLPQLLDELVGRWGFFKKHLESMSRPREFLYVIEEVVTLFCYSFWCFLIVFVISFYVSAAFFGGGFPDGEGVSRSTYGAEIDFRTV